MRILTGMQSSGIPHIGNYFGMMRQTIELQDYPDNECFYFIADLHAFTTQRNPEEFRAHQERCVIDWLALGIDPKKSLFYRQSDIRAHTELTWLLLCQANMGLLQRAHSYKDKLARKIEANAGLFTYPVLMAADILLYDAEVIPVGKDQKQHVEMARDIAQKFNHQFGEVFTLPKPRILKDVQTIPGLDGQKMSKSYGNTIDIFEDETVLRKKVMSIQTASVPLGEPLDPSGCTVFAFHKLFGNPNLKKLEQQYKNGEIGYGDSKKQLFELIWEYFREARERREKLLLNKKCVQEILEQGAQKANTIAEKKLSEVRKKMGLDGKHLA
ncbi:tryptophan--tRNA ligase [Candidatus Gracilibacteria bacterium]|nr:tryptophan--tRNA ligase [Candidatus Gracilibacteria bacterium]MCF7819734.1 tryptophan--tRNA ligase [Candidatus Gracilibacteria bacterium]